MVSCREWAARTICTLVRTAGGLGTASTRTRESVTRRVNEWSGLIARKDGEDGLVVRVHGTWRWPVRRVHLWSRPLVLLLVVLAGLIANGGNDGRDEWADTVSTLQQEDRPKDIGDASSRSTVGGQVTDAPLTRGLLWLEAVAEQARVAEASVTTRGASVWRADDRDLLASEREFLAGYRDHNGRPEWERHFVDDVLPCESTYWGGWYDNGYVSRAQFHRSSWATASANTGLVDPSDPYHVGGNVAWWSNAVDHPGGSGGWPSCWYEGVVP